MVSSPAPGLVHRDLIGNNYIYIKKQTMVASQCNIKGLMKALEWGLKKGLTHVDIETGAEHKLKMTGTLPDGQHLWLIPMSEEQKQEERDSKPKKPEKPIPVVRTTHSRPSDGLDMPDAASDAYDRAMGGWTRDLYESKENKTLSEEVSRIKDMFKLINESNINSGS